MIESSVTPGHQEICGVPRGAARRRRLGASISLSDLYLTGRSRSDAVGGAGEAHPFTILQTNWPPNWWCRTGC